MALVIDEVNALPVAKGVRNGVATALKTLVNKVVAAGLPGLAVTCLCCCSFIVLHPATLRLCAAVMCLCLTYDFLLQTKPPTRQGSGQQTILSQHPVARKGSQTMSLLCHKLLL